MRNCKPLLLADPLPPLTQGFEALVIRAELIADGEVHAFLRQLERHLAVLVMLNPDEASRRQARSFAASFIAAQTSFASDLATLSKLFAVDGFGSADFVHTSLVLALPAYGEPEARQLEEIAARVVPSQHSGVLRIAVAEDTSGWGCLRDFGFVRADAGMLVEAALWTLETVCSLMAPVYLSAFDADDMRQCFGSASNPSRLLALNTNMASQAWLGGGAEAPATPDRGRAVLVRAANPRDLTRAAALVRDHLQSDSDEFAVVCVASAGLISGVSVPNSERWFVVTKYEAPQNA